MSALSEKAVLDTIQADLATVVSTTGGDIVDSLTNVGADVTDLATAQANAALAIQSRKYTFPDKANGIAITGGAAAWQEGAYSEVIATNAITDRFAVYALVVESIVGIHQVTLASGLAAAEVPFSQVTISSTGKYIIQGPAVAANLRVAMKSASRAGGAQAFIGYLEIYKGLQA